MRRRKRLEITVETRRLVIHRRTNQTTVRCLACSSPAEWVSPEEAAAMAGVSTRSLYRCVEAGQLHFIETAEQSLLICLNSLLKPTHVRRK